eukprot:PhF_6_TR34958/c0_g1_i1/m.50728
MTFCIIVFVLMCACNAQLFNHSYTITPPSPQSGDQVYYLELSAQTSNMLNVFSITKIEPSNTPLPGTLRFLGKVIETKTLPIIVHKGLYTRIVVVYNPPDSSSKIYSEKRAFSLEYSVNGVISGYLKLAFREKSVGPKCFPTTFIPVFCDRYLRRVRFNYTVNVEGTNNNFYVSRLVMLKTPPNPIGKLVYQRRVGDFIDLQVLKAGDFFLDHDLEYHCNQEDSKVTGTDVFHYRMEDSQGNTCESYVAFVVTEHLSASDPSTRTDMIKMGTIVLIKLLSDVSEKVTITKPPNYVEMFTVLGNVPSSVDSPFACEDLDCAQYFGVSIRSAGDQIQGNAVFVRAPYSVSVQRDRVFQDYFTYSTLKNPTVALNGVIVINSKLQEIHVWFDSKLSFPPDHIFDPAIDFVDEVRIPISVRRQAFLTSRERACVLPFDDDRRHGTDVYFWLYQFGPNGTKGNRIDHSNDKDACVTDPDMQVILVPKVNSRDRTFTFRTRYDTWYRGNWTSTALRRIVVYRNNTVPRMVRGNQTFNVKVGEILEVVLESEDDEKDRIDFIILKAPRYGYLMQSVPGALGINTERHVREGSRVRVPPQIPSTQTVVSLHYTSPAVVPFAQYPLKEIIEVTADDGWGVLSQRQVITIVISSEVVTASNGWNVFDVTTVLLVGIVLTGTVVKFRHVCQRRA